MTHVPQLGAPHLFDNERELMDRVLAGGCERYLEFGLGGSTLLALRHGAKQVVAVDSDPRWVTAAREHPEIRPAIASGAASLLHADIGPTGDWGHPRSMEDKHRWTAYIRLAWEEWARRGALPNLIYVDGRFRVACCLSVALACASRPEGARVARVLLHDMSADRPHYSDVFKVFEMVEQVGTLHLLRPKAGICTASALSLFMAYQFDAR